MSQVFDSLDALLESDIDAVALFTQRWLHGPQAVKALRAGKHVYSAVPAAIRLEELEELVKTVAETRLVYMMGETSYYRPQTIYCRERFKRGDFGHFVYGEGQYHHDMSHGFYKAYRYSGGEVWKRTASFPPMLYPTHSVSGVLSVTGARMTHVACFGYIDRLEDGVFDPEISLWNNAFSNQTGLFRTSDGGMVRINEFRRIGAGESRTSILGTEAAYEEQTDHGVWTWLEKRPDPVSGGIMVGEKGALDLSWIRDYRGVEITERNLGDLPREYLGKRHLGVTPLHPVERLPTAFVGLENGHCGSHQFLVVDFVSALASGHLPPNHVWDAARYTAPGIVAHASAQRQGERLEIPDYGSAPPDWPLLSIHPTAGYIPT